MKKISFILLASCLTTGVYAQQGLDAVMEQQFKKDKEKSDKAITDEKSAAKAATWLSRAKTYESIATQAMKLDSNAAFAAYEAYKKTIELDQKDGKPGKAAKEAEDALKGQNLFQAFLNSGIMKYQAKNYADASKFTAVAGEINPKDTTAALYGGIFAQQANDMPVAKNNFERYVTNGGKDPSVYYSLATLYQQDKDVDKALATLDKGISSLGGNKDLSAAKVNILINAGRMDDAMKDMQTLAEKDPNNAANWLNLAGIYDNTSSNAGVEIRKLGGNARKGPSLTKQLSEQKDALAAMQGELTKLSTRSKAQPKNAEIKRQLTSVTQMVADKKADIAATEKAIKEQAAQPAGEDPKAKLETLTKQRDESRAKARQFYVKALQIEPNNYDGNYNLGVSYFNEAVELKNQVDAMDMKEYQARGKEMDGQVCGKFKQALPYFEKAKSVKDTEPDLTENLKNLQDILKQFEEKKVACVESK
ncbi:tetratricopeptide repeat protein [Tellurirhabdus bombi]|uniref:tetratricopeptide repeat protein n=1 Tax=Tellurirhabdus bombi TaxID=2907205 RepID=UPI001F32A672|nr:hypothetical protein [Tellurirhabdus bombi]